MFKNNPRDISMWFRDLLADSFRGVFPRIVFAIYDKPEGPSMLPSFKATFGTQLAE